MTPIVTAAVICAWCKKVMRAAAPGHEQDPPSHGICAECEAIERASWPSRSPTPGSGTSGLQGQGGKPAPSPWAEVKP
jgi:hypothetical protein